MARNKPKARKLKHNAQTRFPQYWCFVDTETIQEKQENGRVNHRLRLGVAIFWRARKDGSPDKKQICRFEDNQTFWKWVLSRLRGKNTLHLIAHNALFDFTVLQHQTILTELGFDCSFIFEDGVTFISKWTNGETRLMILDNANWFRGKLATWGEKLGLPKLAMPEESDDIEKWWIYCERDTEILYQLQRWFISFLAENDLGNWRFTLASTSFNAYRHRFMVHPIYIPDKSRETYLARKSYRGGRTECFYRGEFENGPFYKLDVNSMYPTVMRSGLYPVAVEGYTKSPTISGINRFLDTGGLVAHCRLNCTEPYFPIKINKKTAYPIGRFNAYLTTPEFILALENDWIEEVYEAAFYRMRPIFTEFVDFFYGERLKWKQQGDELRSFLFKIFLNSLYGKFGQRGYSDKVIGQANPGEWPMSHHIDIITGERAVIRQIGRNVIKSSKKGEGYNAFTAIASHVTAYARILLYRLVIKAGRENVYYVDTDSLVINDIGLRLLNPYIKPNALGYLKLEGSSLGFAAYAPKHYVFDGKSTIKGIKKNATKVGQNSFRQEVWPGLNKILQAGSETYYNYFVTKTLRATVESGVISDNGQVMPFALTGG